MLGNKTSSLVLCSSLARSNLTMAVIEPRSWAQVVVKRLAWSGRARKVTGQEFDSICLRIIAVETTDVTESYRDYHIHQLR